MTQAPAILDSLQIWFAIYQSGMWAPRGESRYLGGEIIPDNRSDGHIQAFELENCPDDQIAIVIALEVVLFDGLVKERLDARIRGQYHNIQEMSML
jgi:hypothetical protein